MVVSPFLYFLSPFKYSGSTVTAASCKVPFTKVTRFSEQIIVAITVAHHLSTLTTVTTPIKKMVTRKVDLITIDRMKSVRRFIMWCLRSSTVRLHRHDFDDRGPGSEFADCVQAASESNSDYSSDKASHLEMDAVELVRGLVGDLVVAVVFCHCVIPPRFFILNIY
jgi:hypothetical protein